MIVKENITINDKEYIKTYSDEGFYIERDGVKYSEAIDPIDSGRVYQETNELSEDVDPDATEEDYIQVLARLGVDLSNED